MHVLQIDLSNKKSDSYYWIEYSRAIERQNVLESNERLGQKSRWELHILFWMKKKLLFGH